MLHLDDWEHCEDLYNDKVGKQNFCMGFSKKQKYTLQSRTVNIFFR